MMLPPRGLLPVRVWGLTVCPWGTPPLQQLRGVMVEECT